MTKIARRQKVVRTARLKGDAGIHTMEEEFAVDSDTVQASRLRWRITELMEATV
jgi:hypothetical protein